VKVALPMIGFRPKGTLCESVPKHSVVGNGFPRRSKRRCGLIPKKESSRVWSFVIDHGAVLCVSVDLFEDFALADRDIDAFGRSFGPSLSHFSAGYVIVVPPTFANDVSL
jgi:hypothetical protein